MRAFAPLLILLLLACSQEESMPTDLLPRDTFKNVLVEAQLIEARVHHELTVEKRVDTPVTTYYADMFKAQGVSEAAYRRTFDWYTQHPEMLKGVYEEVIADLQQNAE